MFNFTLNKTTSACFYVFNKDLLKNNWCCWGGLQCGGWKSVWVKGNTVVLSSWNAACMKAGSTGTKPNAFTPLPSAATNLTLPFMMSPVQLSFTPHISLSLSLSSTTHETGEPPSPLPPTGSAITLPRPPDRRHSFLPPAAAAVAGRLSHQASRIDL